uniref:Uncharacterized protein n=1 Tax=Panagrolaimus davidi TaxID=227884 RepID=A0A914QUK0_9BILA
MSESDSSLSLGSPLALFVIFSMFLYWIISGIIFFILHRYGNRSNEKSISDKSFDLQYYERGLSRNKVGPVARGVA